MKFFVIVNPKSGHRKGRNILEKVTPLLISAGATVDNGLSEYQGHPYKLANKFALEEYGALLVIGGDGTMHEVVNGMMDREDKKKIPLGLITGGTGNSLMHDLDALDPIKAVEKIINGKTKKIDLAKIKMEEGHLFSFNVIGWGLPVSINKKAESWRWVGGQRYNLASIAEIIRNPNWPVKITIGENEIEGSYAFFLACNTIYSGNGMRVAPKAKLDDGLWDIILFREGSRRRLIQLFTKIFSGRHIDDPLIEYHQVKKFSIYPSEQGILNVDGQLTGRTPIDVEVMNKEIEIFV